MIKIKGREKEARLRFNPVVSLSGGLKARQLKRRLLYSDSFVYFSII